MADKEKLEEYMRENALKESKDPKKKSTSPPPTPKKVQQRTATSWHRRYVIGQFFGYLFLSGLIYFPVYIVVFAIVDVNHGGDEDLVMMICLGILSLMVAANIISSFYNVTRYSSLIKNEHFNLAGWDDFFRKRSEYYWARRNYTQMKMIIKLAPAASDLELNSVKLFTKKTVEKWKKRYEGIDWEPGQGKPKDLVSNGTTLTVDISHAELILFVKILFKFIPLAKILGKSLEEVSIQSTDKEETIKTKKVSRDAYDRQSSRG